MSAVARAIAAATSVAASLDLPANDAIVLHNSNRLALRLTPCDVLARVAHVEHEAAELEVELAQRLAEAGCPVSALALVKRGRAAAPRASRATMPIWMHSTVAKARG
jgi:hypothetical protein